MGAALTMVPTYLFYRVIDVDIYSSQGPACGKCFNLTLLNPVIATPPFYPSVVKHIVVKVTDLCPLSKTGYCSGTNAKPNS